MLETTFNGNPVEVADLDAQWVLALAAQAEVRDREVGRAKLRLGAQWCVLHPATAETGFVTWSPTGLPGLCAHDEALGGAGTPLLAAFSPEPFAAALGVSTLTGMQLLADALDLQHRLPRLWAAVQALAVAPWLARRVAQATHPLSQAGAGHVDTHLAARLTGRLAGRGSWGWLTVERVIAQAIATHDPHLIESRERAGKAAWDVQVQHRRDGAWAGTSHLEVTGDTVDLTRFHDLVCAHAAHLKTLGDTDDLGARKAKAIGLIADHQSTLDLPRPGPGVVVSTSSTSGAAKIQLYLHLSLVEFLDLPDTPNPGSGTGTGVGWVEKLGPVTTARIRDWVAHHQVTITPVLDPARTDTIEAHDPPAWMRELVILRDPHCVFPWCPRDARSCDLDHIDPYHPGGPPGQTRPENLAPLCRRHHRAKTHRRWRYHRTHTGTYHWTGPHTATFLVTPHGTTALQQP